MLPKPRSCAGPLLRVAVILTTLLTLVYSLGLSYVLWKTVILVMETERVAEERGRKSPFLKGTQKLGLYPVAVMWSILGAISLLGLIGAIFKQRAIFSKYVTLTWTHFVFDLIIGCFSIFVLFKNKDWSWFLNLCKVKTTQYNLNSEPCSAPLSTLRGIYVGLFFGGKVLGFGLCWLASSFLYHLRDESTEDLPVNHPLRKVYAGPSKDVEATSPQGTTNDSDASLSRKILPIEYYGPPSPSVREPPRSRRSSGRSRATNTARRSYKQLENHDQGRADSLHVTPPDRQYHDLHSPHAYPPSPSIQEPTTAYSSASPTTPWSAQYHTPQAESAQDVIVHTKEPAPPLSSPSRVRTGGDEPPDYDQVGGYDHRVQPTTMFDDDPRQVHSHSQVTGVAM